MAKRQSTPLAVQLLGDNLQALAQSQREVGEQMRRPSVVYRRNGDVAALIKQENHLLKLLNDKTPSWTLTREVRTLVNLAMELGKTSREEACERVIQWLKVVHQQYYSRTMPAPRLWDDVEKLDSLRPSHVFSGADTAEIVRLENTLRDAILDENGQLNGGRRQQAVNARNALLAALDTIPVEEAAPGSNIRFEVVWRWDQAIENARGTAAHTQPKISAVIGDVERYKLGSAWEKRATEQPGDQAVSAQR